MTEYDSIGNPIPLTYEELEQENQRLKRTEFERQVEEYNRRMFGVEDRPEKPQEVKPGIGLFKKWTLIGIFAIVAISAIYLIWGAIEAYRIVEECKRFAPSVGLSPERC